MINDKEAAKNSVFHELFSGPGQLSIASQYFQTNRGQCSFVVVLTCDLPLQKTQGCCIQKWLSLLWQIKHMSVFSKKSGVRNWPNPGASLIETQASVQRLPILDYRAGKNRIK